MVTAFTPALEAMEGIYELGEILSAPFLKVCKSILPVIDKLKDILPRDVISKIKSDIGLNIEWLEKKYKEYNTSNRKDFNYLDCVIEADIDDQNHKIYSVGVAVLRLTRLMDFLVQLFRNLTDEDKRGWTFCEACTDSYDKTLKQWRNGNQNFGLTLAMLEDVNREEFMKVIGCAGDHHNDMRDFCSTLSRILKKNHEYLKKIGMDNLKA